MNSSIKVLLKVGYPYRIIGDDEREAVLVGVQPLNDGYCAIYRYPRCDKLHDLEYIANHATVIEQEPKEEY